MSTHDQTIKLEINKRNGMEVFKCVGLRKLFDIQKYLFKSKRPNFP